MSQSPHSQTSPLLLLPAQQIGDASQTENQMVDIDKVKADHHDLPAESGSNSILDELVRRSLEDIARELQMLRQENSDLKVQVSLLSSQVDSIVPELTIAQREHYAFRSAIKHLMKEGGFLQASMHQPPLHIASFPPEILLRIFRATRTPLHEHDPSITSGSKIWLDGLRFRTRLVLVCKAWSGPATAVLYEDIVIRRMGQIPALARTLASPQGSSDLALLIQHLRMDSCVIWAPCADVVREDLLFILQQCTALRSLSFHTHPNFPNVNSPDDAHGWDAFNPSWFIHDHTDNIGRALQDRMWSGLNELDISIHDGYVGKSLELHMILSTARSLRILKLGPVEPTPGDYAWSWGEDAFPNIQFPALEELQVYTDHPQFYDVVCERWAIPHLAHLTAVNCYKTPVRLLKQHGAHLKYLHLCPTKQNTFHYDWASCELTALDRFGELCPVLDHLVVAAYKPGVNHAHILEELRSPTVRYLDIWCYNCAAKKIDMETEREEAVEIGELPNLVRVRRLRRALRLDLPVVCHPELIVGDDSRIWKFPRYYVKQTSWGVIPDFDQYDAFMEWSEEVNALCDELSAPSDPYEPDSGIEDEDAVISEEEGEDLEDGNASDSEMGGHDSGPERFGRDTILTMFKTSLRDSDNEGGSSQEDSGSDGEEQDEVVHENIVHKTVPSESDAGTV